MINFDGLWFFGLGLNLGNFVAGIVLNSAFIAIGGGFGTLLILSRVDYRVGGFS